MKKRLTYIPMMLLAGAALAFGVSSCVKDGVPGGECRREVKAANLLINVADAERVMTRAEGEFSERTDCDKVERLDIVLANLGRVTKVIRLAEGGDNPTVGADDFAGSGVVEGSGAGILKFRVGSVDMENVTHIYVVANYIDAAGEVAMLPVNTGDAANSLQRMSQGRLREDVCTMFGQVNVFTDAGVPDAAHPGNYDYEIALQRTMAMVTVAVDGSNLRQGVTVRPLRAALHRVPRACLITGENKPAEVAEIAADGMTAELGMAEGAAVARATTVRDGFTCMEQFPAAGVAHGADAAVVPLFAFENLQGVNVIAGGDEVDKAPVREELATYVDVVVAYEYLGALDNGEHDAGFGHAVDIHTITGEVTYRFYLGANVTDDFNVRRNHHYQLTLSLTNWGGLVEEGKVKQPAGTNGYVFDGAEEGISWRVETDVIGTSGIAFEHITVDGWGETHTGGDLNVDSN